MNPDGSCIHQVSDDDTGESEPRKQSGDPAQNSEYRRTGEKDQLKFPVAVSQYRVDRDMMHPPVYGEPYDENDHRHIKE